MKESETYFFRTCLVESNHKLQIPNNKQIPMTEIQNSKLYDFKERQMNRKRYFNQY